MEKIKVKINLPDFTKVNRNIVLAILLVLAVAFSVMRIIFSAPPDPGHGWADIGDNPNDALTVGRGGTGTTSLPLNNVILGNTTGAVKFVAYGTAGNVLTSNGTTWASSALTGAVTLLYDDETNSTEYSSTVTETPLKSWVMNISPSLYSSYIIEAEVRGNQGFNPSNGYNVGFNWNFYEDANLKDTVTMRTIGANATGIATGVSFTQTISAIINNSIPASANFILNGQMNNSNAGVTMMALSFRVYGVK
jgi:hypothetical protein